MTRTVAPLIVTLLSGVVPAFAHHAFSAYYFEEYSVTVHGVVQTFEYRNPHTILVISVPRADGGEETFTAEWSSPGRLRRDGVAKDTLKPGDIVVVTGSPGRVAAEYKLHLKGIRRPADGWRWGRGYGSKVAPAVSDARTGR